MFSFGGLLQQIITATNDPSYYVGQSFSGFYEYQSTDGNGVFFCPPDLADPGTNTSLTGLLYLPFSPPTGGRLNAFPVTPNLGSLTVTGGVVTGFTWSSQEGDYYAQFSKDSFRISNLGADPQIETTGLMLWGLPLRQG